MPGDWPGLPAALTDRLSRHSTLQLLHVCVLGRERGHQPTEQRACGRLVVLTEAAYIDVEGHTAQLGPGVDAGVRFLEQHHAGHAGRFVVGTERMESGRNCSEASGVAFGHKKLFDGFAREHERLAAFAVLKIADQVNAVHAES